MYAIYNLPTGAAIVDSNDRERWALFGPSSATETIQEWRQQLLDGTCDRDSLTWTLIADHSHTVDLAPQDRTAQGVAMAAMRRREADLTDEVERLRTWAADLQSRVHNLQSAQVTADDSRLSEFWELAHQAADNAGHCEIFDRLCDELGGPTRSIDVDVTVSYTFSTTMSRTDYANGDYEGIDPSDHLSTYDLRQPSDWEVSEA